MTDLLKKHGAAILCGGRSHRMGFDKAAALLNRRGEPLLFSLAVELAARFADVTLVTNDLDKFSKMPEELFAFERVLDLHPGAGPAGAIHTALAARPGRSLFIMACDMPDIDWGLAEKLAELMEAEGADVAVPRHGALREPLFGFYGPAALSVFGRGLAAGLRKVWLFYDELKIAYLDLNEDEAVSSVLRNINTPEDIFRAGLPFPPVPYVRTD